ncbi:MAG: GlsB/YeaQ/YmgE family stress response membrane protein [Verrucomicrobia bacterium]|nr:GlsB/YeaQ/YmgE family stress response membrane protein [Verrucomicrobiota bacterium]
MNLEQAITFLVIGAVAGWLAGLIFKRGFGLIGNIVVGVLGAFLGGWLFNALGISVGGELIGAIVTATAGSVVLLFAVGLIKKL